MSENQTGAGEQEAVIDYMCPMPECSFSDTVRWPLSEFPESLKGVTIGDTVEGPPFSCPDCEDRGVVHSDLFEVHGTLNTRSLDTGDGR